MVGELLCWGEIAQGAVGALGVVVHAILLNRGDGVIERREPVPIKALVAELPVEGFDEAILAGFSWSDEAQGDPVLMDPGIQWATDELRAVVDRDPCRLPVPGDDPLQGPHHPLRRQAQRHLDAQAFPGEDINHVERADAPPISQLVAGEVHAPLHPRMQRAGQWLTLRARDLLPPFPPHRQAFLAIEPLDPLAVDALTFPAQQRMEPTVAVSRVLRGQLAQSRDQRRRVAATTAIPLRRATHSYQPAGPAFAESVVGDHGLSRLASTYGRSYFPPTTSFNAWMSNA